ncbi:hypothetical protein ACQPZF_01390 [Actinosynnema sp. CS-041913]|uniref:hypothetical protein n=1 Tax=Actinosynnema sp. CS-041913 TaxID=3239917 RepID=UPI003D8C7C83
MQVRYTAEAVAAGDGRNGVIRSPDGFGSNGSRSNGSGGFQRAVDPHPHIPGVEQSVADDLVAEAHRICPYSTATRGNIEVALTATV